MASKYGGVIVKLCEEHGIPPEAAKLAASEPTKQLFLLTPGDITSTNCFYWEKSTAVSSDATNADTDSKFIHLLSLARKVLTQQTQMDISFARQMVGKWRPSWYVYLKESFILTPRK